MYEQEKSDMQCAEFENLLADALDGSLNPVHRGSFFEHRRACIRCAAVYTEAEDGLRLLAVLKGEELEPPARLLENILRVTSEAEAAGTARQPGRQTWWRSLRDWPALAPVFQAALQPRFAMSFAMVFFSVTAALTIAGVKISDVRRADLRPHAIVRSVYSARSRAVRYYENIRFVYEIESRVRDLKRANPPEENAPRQTAPKDQSGEPDQNRFRNYSQENAELRVASKAVGPQLSTFGKQGC